MDSALEFWVFLPQMRMTMDQLVDRAQAAEAAGFAGVASMDHLAPPGAEGSPMFEAMITNAWLAGRTEQLHVGSLVLCDSFRHPAVLAREAVSLDHASGGRFELGLGWGSVADELRAFGIGSPEPKVRLSRLRESLEIITALWAGETVDYEGEHFHLQGAHQQPGPLTRIPIVIGGAGKGTMRLVAAHADWWNVHTGIVDKLDEMRPVLRGRTLFAAGPGRLRPACGVAGGDRADGAAALRPHPGRRYRGRARGLLRRTPGSRHRAGLRLVL